MKAYYIVFYFHPHMKFEKLPMQVQHPSSFVLIIYLIFIAIYEGIAIGMIPG